MRPVVPPIINTRVAPTKNRRTLVHFGAQDVAHPRWAQWDGVVSSVADFVRWSDKARVIAAVIRDCDVIEDLAPFTGRLAYLFVPAALFHKFTLDQWRLINVNVGIIERFHDDYPIVERAWDGTPSDAIASVALLLHYFQIVDCGPLSVERSAQLQRLGVTLSVGITPPSIWLLTQYFVHKTSKRAREIRQCLKNNLQNPYLDRIVLLNEEDLKYEWSSMRGADKVEQVLLGHRLTYADLLRYTLEHVPANTIVVFSNADIYCNETLQHLYSVSMKDNLFALLRYDERAGPDDLVLFGPRPDSQDAWILDADSVRARTWNLASFEYKLGTAGCDNRFTGDMFGMRFLVSNPCYTIQTVHLHKTEIRDYNKMDIVPAKIYLYVHPCSLLDVDQSKSLGGTGPKAGALSPRTASITIRAPTPKMANTYCTMLAREKRFTWAHDRANAYEAKGLVLQTWPSSFVMSAGLVYDYKKVYFGADEVMDPFLKAMGRSMEVSYVKKCERVARMLAIPCATVQDFVNPDLYCVRYLSRAIQAYAAIAVATATAEAVNPALFVFPGNMDTLNTFQVLPGSQTAKVEALEWSPQSLVFANEVVGYIPEATEVCVADIAALRSAWRESSPRGSLCVVLVDEVLTPECAVEQIAPLLPVGWSVECVPRSTHGIDAYRRIAGASLCLLYNLPHQDDQWSKVWALPKGCKVIEFQNELKVEGAFQQFAAACEFNTWLIPLYKGSPADMRTQAVDHMKTWIGAKNLGV